MKKLPSEYRSVMSGNKELARVYDADISQLMFYQEPGPWFDAGSSYGDTWRYNPRTKELLTCTETCAVYPDNNPPVQVAERVKAIDAFWTALPNVKADPLSP